MPLTRGVCAPILIGLIACQPGTGSRISVSGASGNGTMAGRVVPEATQALAQALEADSIPRLRVRLRDGYIESSWFDVASRRPTKKRPIGPGIARVRAWADPARPGDTQLRVETVYRPLADPSLPERELERQVRPDHPVAVQIRNTLQDLLKRYGGPPNPEAQPSGGPTEENPPDE